MTDTEFLQQLKDCSDLIDNLTNGILPSCVTLDSEPNGFLKDAHYDCVHQEITLTYGCLTENQTIQDKTIKLDVNLLPKGFQVEEYIKDGIRY